MDISIGIVIFSFLLISSCSSQELKLSQVVHRHGQRSPVQFYPNDPHKNFWTDGPGQLTNVGKMEAYRLGQFLRKRYVINDNFLNKTFKHSYIHVRSSDEDRTLESAELVLAGLYPPYEENIWNKNLLWEPIAVHTVPKVNDYLLQYSGTDCPRFSSEFQKAAKVDPLKSFAEKYQSLYTYLSSKSGMEIDATNSWIIYDNMFNELLHKLEPPYWALKKMKELTEENAEKYGLYVPNNILQRIKGGPLVKEIISNFDKHVNQSSSVKSSEVNRVLESAELVLAGLYPPYKNNIWNKNLLWQPIAVHSVPKKVDYLLEYYGTDCPRFLSEYQKATKVDPLKAFEEKYQSLYKYLSSNSGMKKVNQTNAWIVYDDSFNEMLHNLTPPAWVLNNITQLKEQSTGDFVLLVPNKELKKLKGGPLVKEIISNFDKNINNESLVKMYQFSTHDTILAVLMSTLKIFNDILPPYSSAIIFELFKNKSGNASHPEDTHSVKISYRNDSRVDPFVLSLPGCAQLCPLEKFKSLTKDIIPEDIAKECGLSTPNYAASLT
ncbi:Testicular acid phosphatase [Nymphon striatum]|nr:Testicular acid phosphatase [Nymphon striatum]